MRLLHHLRNDGDTAGPVQVLFPVALPEEDRMDAFRPRYGVFHVIGSIGEGSDKYRAMAGIF